MRDNETLTGEGVFFVWEHVPMFYSGVCGLTDRQTNSTEVAEEKRHGQLDRKDAERMRVAACCSFLCGFLQLCSALNINCTVTNDDLTRYSISDVSQVSDAKAKKCEYSWTGTQVIANQNGEMTELVLINNINTLVILKCLDNIVFTRSCISEGIEYTASCTVNCTLKALRRTQKDKETRNWIPTIVVFIIFLLVVLMFLGFLYSKRKTCSQLGCIYTVVTKQSSDPKPSDVEAGNE